MAQQIPQFGLYGEGRWIDHPDFVHIEDIAARSSDLGWHIKAHKHTQLLQILLLKRGSVRLQMDDEERFLEGKWAIIIPAETVHSFRFTPNTDGRVLSISDTLLSPSSAKSLYVTLPNAGYIDLNELEDFQHLWQLITLLEYEFHRANHGKTILIEHLLKAILVLIERHNRHAHVTQLSHEDRVIMRLKNLVNDHVKDHWKTPQYATQLNVSEKTLNRITQQAFGKSVLQLTHERLLLEAKRHLIYTQKSIEEIAFDLGFKDPGYFSRFFKRQEQMTPAKYRKLSESKVHLPPENKT